MWTWLEILYACEHLLYITKNKGEQIDTLRFLVPGPCFTQNQYVLSPSKRVFVNSLWSQIDVTVFSCCLSSTRTVEIPDWQFCNIRNPKRQRLMYKGIKTHRWFSEKFKVTVLVTRCNIFKQPRARQPLPLYGHESHNFL